MIRETFKCFIVRNDNYDNSRANNFIYDCEFFAKGVNEERINNTIDNILRMLLLEYSNVIFDLFSKSYRLFYIKSFNNSNVRDFSDYRMHIEFR